MLFPPPSQPWIIGLIQPEEMKGFRFNLCTKTGFANKYRDLAEMSQEQHTFDFESVFWNNGKCLYITFSFYEFLFTLHVRSVFLESKLKSITRIHGKNYVSYAASTCK